MGGFRLQDACAGGGLVLPTPAPRQRSAALEARCAELRKRLEQQQYDALVHDITQPACQHLLLCDPGLGSHHRLACSLFRV